MSPANHDPPNFLALESDPAGNIARNDACGQATDKIRHWGCSSRVVCWHENASIEETHVMTRRWREVCGKAEAWEDERFDSASRSQRPPHATQARWSPDRRNRRV